MHRLGVERLAAWQIFLAPLGLGCDHSSIQARQAAPEPLDAARPNMTSGPGLGGPRDAGPATYRGVGPAITKIIPSERLTEWNPGLNAVGGIPTRTIIHSTLTPSGGDDTGAIQKALDECPPNQVVLLGPGHFNITGEGLSITRSYVTLRGSGRATQLVKPRGTQYPVVIVGHRWPKYADQTPLAADANKETNAVTLHGAPPSGVPWKVGELVVIDHVTNDVTSWSGRSPPGSPSREWFGEPDRPIGQVLELDAVVGNRLTFTTRLHTDFLVADSARIARFSGDELTTSPVQWSGIEDLYVAYGEGGDGGGNIHLFATKYCWVKNVESDRSNGTSISLDGTFRCAVTDSYMHSTVDPNPGGAGYGFGVNAYASDNLLENSISWNFNKVMVMRKSGGGNVIGYNYMEDGYGADYPTSPEVGLNASHMTTPHYELFEGNQSYNFDSDSVWGNSIYITVFRNHLTTLRRSLKYGTADGVKVRLSDTNNRHGIGLTTDHWWYSFVGNVIGYPSGYLQYPSPFSPRGQSLAFVYEWIGGVAAGGNDGQYTPMWQIGYDAARWGSVPDAKVVSTTIRHGNFDYVTRAVAWDTKIDSRELPASLYLTSKPAFFGSDPWPWVVPENPALPLAGLPARTRFDRMP
jgi:hypothetical protein